MKFIKLIFWLVVYFIVFFFLQYTYRYYFYYIEQLQLLPLPIFLCQLHLSDKHLILKNIMVLQELRTIDTIYIEGRKFILQKNIFLKKIETGFTSFYVEWKVNAFSKLKEEGMGLISREGSTKALKVSRSQTTEETGITENHSYLSPIASLQEINCRNSARYRDS